MIVISTGNGDNFVNEKETHIISHDKKNRRVCIRSHKDGLNCFINDVEKILCLSDTGDVIYEDVGSHMV